MNRSDPTPALGERPNCDFNQAYAWATAITGDADKAVFNWRFIHDRDKATAAIKRRGTLAQVWFEACDWSAKGYGIFATVNEMDGTGYDANGRPIQGQTGDTLEHVVAVRAHIVDCDNLNALANVQRASQHTPAPWFAVQTSPGKAHIYWPLHGTQGGADREQYRLLQRKLRQLFDGDKAVVDATRVLRVPGFLHQKGAPHLVTFYQLPGYGQPISRDMLAISVAHVNAVDEGGGRHPLGDSELAAPSAEWARYALETMPVEGMDHNAFISFTAAWKQAAWTVLDHNEMWILWLNWCERFGASSKGTEYNLKHWNSISDTEVGWKSLLRQNPALNGAFMFYGSQHQPVARSVESPPSDVSPIPIQSPQALGVGDLMLADDYAKYFAGCIYVVSENRMLTPRGIMDEARFKNTYGGPRFVIAPNNTAPTDDAWKAATRSFFGTVPKVDAVVLRPDRKPNEIFKEGRKTFVNAFVRREFNYSDGDVTPFLDHTAKLFPSESDRKHLFDYLAHCIKYPGIKVRYALFIQSTEGAGKNPFKYLLRHAYGVEDGRFYSPKAKNLDEGGGKFNKYMKDALFILVDEIKVNQKYRLMDTLKEFITEKDLEIEAKGFDGQMGENLANWAFFSNHKDALVIDRNARRYLVLFSAMQSPDDLKAAGMNDDYFEKFWSWWDRGGMAAVAGWLLRRDVAAGGLPSRAPHTSSWDEAVNASLPPVAAMVKEAMDVDMPGFRGGWVSTSAIASLWAEQRGSLHGMPQGKTLERDLGSLGLKPAGRAKAVIMQEFKPNGMQGARPSLYHKDGEAADRSLYPEAQGYEQPRGSLVHLRQSGPIPGQLPSR